MATRVTSSRLIGRAPELAELEAALADAASGRPTLAFVAGDSGVGKSRLLAELAARAEASGARYIRGDCVELGDDELPYAPLIGALRPLVRASDPAFDDLPPSARAALGTLLPELGDREPAPPVAGRDPDADGRGRLFDALLALLERLSRERPLVFALEDLHWADRSTRAHLVYLARNLWTERVLIVGTYRSDELHRRHPLRPLLAELERDPRAVRVALSPFTPDELAGQLTDILGAPPEQELVERLHARSEGNALFTEELLAAGLDGRGPLPETLRDALMVRVGRLGEPAQEVLRVLAAGRVLSHDVLAQAAGLDDPTLRVALRETVDANIVTADERELLRFRHALLREVVHDDLLPGEHADLHHALAEALEARVAEAGDDPLLLAGIAHHYLSAGCQEDALRASVAAAGAAEAVHAPGEAASFLERALDLWDRVPEPEEIAGADRVNLLARAGAAHSEQGDYARAEALLERAVAACDATTHPHRAARLLERLARAQWSLGRARDAGDTIARAADLVPAGAPSVERARILAWQAKALMLRGRYGETLPVAREAIEAAEAAGSREARGGALNALGIALLSTGEPEAGAAALREALEASQTVAERCSASVNLADALHLVGRGREAREVAAAGLATADEAGPAAAAWLAMTAAQLEWDHGAWAAARAAMPDPGLHLHGLTLVFAELLRAEMDLADGEHDRARARLDRVGDVAAGSREPQFIGWAGALRAELEHRDGALTKARTAIDDALDAIEFCSDDRSRVALLAERGAAIEAAAAQRASDLGDGDGERLAVLRAEAYAERARACAGDDRPVETARRWLAEAETAVARGAGEPGPFAEAACAWEALERPYPAALARLRLAETLVARGDRDAAADALAEALETAQALGAAWLSAEARALAARARLGVPEGDDEAPVAPPEAAAADPFGLTPRERQVLALVAEGATNREIGARLFMAEKTASVHVSRILAKLDVRSRTEAAGVAHRLGLSG